MKNHILIALFISISLNCIAQPNFQRGYFINNENEKTECFINNRDWKNNPRKFQYKLSKTSEPLIATIEKVHEFCILNTHKYNRLKVSIDRSSDNINTLDKTGAIKLNEEVLFLKTIVEGKATLYKYEDKDVKRFFYKIDNKKVFPLIYKRYNDPYKETIIRENDQYRQQLWTYLKCSEISIKDIENIDYDLNDLSGIFEKFNTYHNPEYANPVYIEQKDLINLSLRPGINNSSLAIGFDHSNAGNIDFGNHLNFRFGLEAELIVPFNNNKWSILIEPTYHYFKTENSSIGQLVNIDYKSVEVPVGLRHYYIVNDKSRVFINGLFVFDFGINPKIQFENDQDMTLDYGNILNISRKSNFALGLGYNHNDKYSLEMRYRFNCEIFNEYPYWSSKYKTLSIIFGYSII